MNAGPTGAIVTSTGSGLLLQVGSFAGLLVGSALPWIGDLSQATAELLVQRSIENLGLVRRLLRDEPVPVPTRLAFANVRLPDGIVLTTPWGQLRPAGTQDVDFAPKDMQRTRSHACGPNETITVQESGDMILEGSAALRIRVLRSLEEQRPQEDWHTPPQHALIEASRHLQLAFLLALRVPAAGVPPSNLASGRQSVQLHCGVLVELSVRTDGTAATRTGNR